MKTAPIILFVYNRPKHTAECLKMLSVNDLAADSVLYIYADGPKENATQEERKRVEDTREVIRSVKGFKNVEVIASQINKGLASSVIEGVTKVTNEHGKAVVLEDDILTSSGFLSFMNEGLNRYEQSENVMQISGHLFPHGEVKKEGRSFFIPMTTTWGWGTWKRAWDKFDPKADGYVQLKSDLSMRRSFDLDGSYPYSKMLEDQMDRQNIDSWGIRWWWSVFKVKGITLYPDSSLVQNIGFGEEGTHTHGSDPFLLKEFDKQYHIFEFPSSTKIDELNFTRVKNFLEKSFMPKEKQSFIKALKKMIGF